ncbi:hypothetical protein [Streptomyces roseochromogenus]|uniref:Uncharacterized protein n=1 Tax=Streptomyces roseochromogenus subsp. oscitans DS 12.976 TaxID=1352936 RepID=V6K175_STRRC|nr:hypothetical protein [Streptomyces roseochromogenus]EST25798.1 hypothetical protein M878_28090 [Streptomyces roseochromogenus subsp. oscitans DS 12.976]
MTPENTPATAPTAVGMTEDEATVEARRIIAEAYRPAPEVPTVHRDDSPLPRYGSTPPVAQPGRPPMSQGATDASVLMLTGGASVSMVGLTAAVVMYVSQTANPVVCAIVFGAPTALVLALARLAKRSQPAPDVHQHYTGPVYQDQRNVHTTTRGVWAKTTNQQ